MAGEKILSIDDSPTVQRLIEMILTSQGYQVVLAADGEAGIATAKAEKPAVILVDFVMPKMNGFQVCKSLKEDPEFRDIPIILVTSKGDKVGSKFVDVLGITEYFTKPFQPEDLLAKIREVIDKGNGPGQAVPGSDGARAAYSASEAASAQSAQQGANSSRSPAIPAALENLVRELVERILDDFAKTTLPDLIRQELGKGPAAGQPGIQGNLASFRIVEVLQMLGLQRQTGKLTISRGNDGIEIYFRDGAVAYATSASGGGGIGTLLKKTCRIEDDAIGHVMRIADMTTQPIDSVLAQEKLLDLKTFADCLKRHTESAVYKAMGWREGDFVFDKVPIPNFTKALRLKVDDLLLEGARRADEWTLIQQKISDFSLVYEPMIGNAEELSTRGMSDCDLKVFSLIDGRRTVEDVIDASALCDFDVAKSMFILLSVNLIRKKK